LRECAIQKRFVEHQFSTAALLAIERWLRRRGRNKTSKIAEEYARRRYVDGAPACHGGGRRVSLTSLHARID
jgi:hypothetical protein